jgi:hypothetical protein
MTEEQRKKYESTDALKKAVEALRDRKFRLDCGHHVTFNHHLANDITVINGKELKIICSLCGH